MGKAAKFKKLRKLAAQLPEIHTKRPTGFANVQGMDVMARGINQDTNGKDIDANKNYKVKTFAEAPLNHNRNLKNAYKKAGMQGAVAYASAVANYVKSKTA